MESVLSVSLRSKLSTGGYLRGYNTCATIYPEGGRERIENVSTTNWLASLHWNYRKPAYLVGASVPSLLPFNQNTMIKLYITAIESKPDGTAVTLFEDFLLGYQDVDRLRNAVDSLNDTLANKIEEAIKEPIPF